MNWPGVIGVFTLLGFYAGGVVTYAVALKIKTAMGYQVDCKLCNNYRDVQRRLDDIIGI